MNRYTVAWISVLLRGLSVGLALSMGLSACALPKPGELENLVTQRDVVAVNEKQRADIALMQLQNDGKLLPKAHYSASTDLPEQYLSTVLQRLYPREHQRYRVHIARLPGENAMALSSGVVVVHLGLLAALQNYHQLAFVLAHEIEHIRARHGYVSAHQRRNARARAHLGDILTLGSGSSYRYYANALRGFNRAQELEADTAAARVLIRAGLDVGEAARFFRVLSAYPGGTAMHSLPGTHPSNEQRERELMALARSYRSWPDVHRMSMPDSTGEEAFGLFRQQMLELSIKDKLADLDLVTALVQLQELKRLSPESGFVSCATGDINYRMATTQPVYYAETVYALEQRTNSPWTAPVVFSSSSARVYFLNRALAAYESTLVESQQSSCAERGLALVLASMGRATSARKFLTRYMVNNPTAADKDYLVHHVRSESQSEQKPASSAATIEVTDPLVDIVLHRVVDDPRVLIDEQKRLRGQIDSALRTGLKARAQVLQARRGNSQKRLNAVREQRYQSARLFDNHTVLTALQEKPDRVNLGINAARFAARSGADKLLLSRYRGWRKSGGQWRKERTSSALQTVATLGLQRVRSYPQFGELELLLVDGRSGLTLWRGTVSGDPQSVVEAIPGLLQKIEL